MATLSHSEFQAAQHALSRIASGTGTLGSKLGGLANGATHNATSIGGSFRAQTLRTPSLLPGTGRDTYFGGARSSAIAGVGNDTIVGGSAKFPAGSLEALSGHTAKNFALGVDTINIAGTTALSVKSLDPSTIVKGHTVSVGDKTTITINGLSTHDISKLSH
jgi:hypothetical protein